MFTTDYTCGDTKTWGKKYQFKAIRDDPAWQPSIALFGDMGHVNPQSLPRLQNDVSKDMYDAIFHVGQWKNFYY